MRPGGEARRADCGAIRTEDYPILAIPDPTSLLFSSTGGTVANFKQQLLDKLEARTAQVGVIGLGYVGRRLLP